MLRVLAVDDDGMSGSELLGAVREREGLAELPAIVLSARVGEQDIATGRRLGAISLTEPFVGSALDNAIKRACPDDDGW